MFLPGRRMLPLPSVPPKFSTARLSYQLFGVVVSVRACKYNPKFSFRLRLKIIVRHRHTIQWWNAENPSKGRAEPDMSRGRNARSVGVAVASGWEDGA